MEDLCDNLGGDLVARHRDGVSHIAQSSRIVLSRNLEGGDSVSKYSNVKSTMGKNRKMNILSAEESQGDVKCLSEENV